MPPRNTKLAIVIFYIYLSSGNGQNLPSVDSFLMWLFNTTINGVINMANNFNFHDVETDDIKFLYYGKRSNNSIQIKAENHRNLIDPSKPVKFIIHGWQSEGTADFIKAMATNYHKKGNYNVIAVDWSEHSKKIYMHASSVTKNVGELIADFIVTLMKYNLTTLGDVHLIGHSLGAHVAGFAGQRVAQRARAKLGRITGLDAAGPLFEFPVKRPTEFRLSRGDASYVDGIHTNAGFLGFADAFATADYYVDNGGPIQPGCIDINMFEAFVCSHSKSHEYYAQSIRNKKFEALLCPNPLSYQALLCNNNKRALMGENTSKKDKGVYYLKVESALPYRGIFNLN